jgi:iron complex transport system substrate-binding protein
MKRFTILLILLMGFVTVKTTAAPPARVVSINLCTDQLLVMLAAPEQIASLSYLAADPDSSFVADRAGRYPLNHARLEELIALNPDLVVVGTPANPRLLAQLEQLGLSVEQFPLTHSIAGIEQDIRRLARLLQQETAGEALIERMTTNLPAPDSSPETSAPKAIFYQPRGYTSGTGTLQDEALRLAGWRNLAAELGVEGYAQIDLERLLLSSPERIFTSSHHRGTGSRAEAQLDHPALRRMMQGRPLVEIPYKYWLCAGPMITDAVALLLEAHEP